MHWNQLSYHYMSEESSDEEDGLTIFKLHSPSWEIRRYRVKTGFLVYFLESNKQQYDFIV